MFNSRPTTLRHTITAAVSTGALFVGLTGSAAASTIPAPPTHPLPPSCQACNGAKQDNTARRTTMTNASLQELINAANAAVAAAIIASQNPTLASDAGKRQVTAG